MNFLLTEAVSPGAEQVPMPAGADARGTAGDIPYEAASFALLLHRVFAVDPEGQGQDVEITEFSRVPAVADALATGADDGLATIVPAQLPAPPGIDRDLFASVAAGALDIAGAAVATPVAGGAALPTGGSGLPTATPIESPGVGAGVAASMARAPAVAGRAATPSAPSAAANPPDLPFAGGLADAPTPDTARRDAWRPPLPAAIAGAAGDVAPAAATGPVAAPPPPRLDVAAAEFVAARPAEAALVSLVTPLDARPAALAGEAAPLPLPPGGGAREWGEAIGERINWMINREQSAATLRLDPPTLGKLDVQLRISDDATTIAIQAQHAQTRELLDAAAPRLRELLLDNGFNNVNVDVSQRQERQLANGGDDARAPGDVEPDAEAAAEPDTVAARTSTGDRLLDTFA